jgi:hypothetical protein
VKRKSDFNCRDFHRITAKEDWFRRTSTAERREMLRHIEGCPTCRNFVSEMARREEPLTAVQERAVGQVTMADLMEGRIK